VDARPLSYSTSGVSRVISRILYHFPDKNKYQFYLYSNRPPHSDFDDILQLRNTEWIQGSGILSRYGGSWFNASLPFLIRKNPPDLFWGSQQVLPPFLPSGMPAVLTYYDLVLYFFPDAMRFLARIQQRAVQRYSVNRADRILSISTQTMNDMIQKFHYPPEKAGVSLLGYEQTIRNSSSENIKKPHLKKNKPETFPEKNSFILSVSTMEPRKNYSTLLKAYEKYLELEKKPLKLVIAGRRGWESSVFFQNLDRMIGEGKVITFENANDSLIEELYQNAAFFVMPAVYEGFGLPLLEALCSGKYAIASNIGPFHEIGGNSISYVDALDTEAWTGSLTAVTELFRKKQLKLKGFRKNEWTWERTARIHQEAFDELS